MYIESKDLPNIIHFKVRHDILMFQITISAKYGLQLLGLLFAILNFLNYFHDIISFWLNILFQR